MKYFLLTLFTFPFAIFAQDDLLDMLESETSNSESIEYTYATFKGSRMINGHSVELKQPGELEFLISHRFQPFNTGFDGFYGLDGANIRLALEYGINEWANVGLGRSSYKRTVDLFGKAKILRQSNQFPISVVAFASIVNQMADDFEDQGIETATIDQLAYTTQILIARKFSNAFSLQIVPTFVHHNRVNFDEENNNLAIGIGGRTKLTQRISLNLEYYHQLSDKYEESENALAVGFDIETGGHVFQLHFTNAEAMNEKAFITQTDTYDLRFGFNISRTFTLK